MESAACVVWFATVVYCLRIATRISEGGSVAVGVYPPFAVKSDLVIVMVVAVSVAFAPKHCCRVRVILQGGYVNGWCNSGGIKLESYVHLHLVDTITCGGSSLGQLASVGVNGCICVLVQPALGCQQDR